MLNLTLNNEVKIPQLGLGVFQTPKGEDTVNSVKWALEAGYRHIDTAKIYGNESDVGTGIKESNIAREEIFLTTKLWNEDIRAERTREAFEESLKALQTDYVDLYLIHWPVESFEKAWMVMEELYQEGKIKAIGLSNFHQSHLEKIQKIAKVKPVVNQIESHPYMNNQALINLCKSIGMEIEVWSPLGGTGGNVLEDETLNKLAAKYGKSAAQIVLRWDIQREVIVIPKSIHKDRIIANIDIFDFKLTDEDMALINNLNKNLRVGPNPDNFDF
jgi:diketogulonate reductase-like aldo/keto reductase